MKKLTLEEVEKFTNYVGSDQTKHFTEYLLDHAGSVSGKRFNSGFISFDEKMGGIEIGELIVVSGHRKEGKTLFATSWIKRMMDTDPEARAFILSYEVNPDRVLASFVSNSGYKIYLPNELKTMDFGWLKERCLEAKIKFNCNILLIDHLHFMVDMETRQNMSLNIGAFMRRLKREIALDLDYAVILIAHQGQPKEGKEASIDGIRDSSFVGQESDSTVIVARRQNYDGADIREIEMTKGLEVASMIKPPKDSEPEDKYSAGLALVKIECHRRTGTYKWSKLFQKRGEFLEEV